MNNKDEILVDSEDYIYGTIYSRNTFSRPL